MKKVSVIVPCFNVEKYLRQCMDSIVNQTLKDIEVICIDDGSTDSTPDILREYEANDSRVKVISKPNSGYGASMNIGLKTANAEYIGIIESDDYIELNMFERLYTLAKENDLEVARCNFYQYYAAEDKHLKMDFSYVPKDEVYAPIERVGVFFQQPSIWVNIYKREFLEKNDIKFLPTPGASYQDTAFTFKVYAMAKRFMMIDDALLHYRLDNETSSVNSRGKVYCVCDEYKEIVEYSKKHEIYDEFRRLIPRLRHNCYSWNFNRLAFPEKFYFLLQWGKELRKDFFQGNIRKRFFEKTPLLKSRVIALFPIAYIFRKEL